MFFRVLQMHRTFTETLNIWIQTYLLSVETIVPTCHWLQRNKNVYPNTQSCPLSNLPLMLFVSFVVPPVPRLHECARAAHRMKSTCEDTHWPLEHERPAQRNGEEIQKGEVLGEAPGASETRRTCQLGVSHSKAHVRRPNLTKPLSAVSRRIQDMYF